MSNILVVDDEPAICWGLTRLAESLGHEVLVASSAERGLVLAAENAVDLLVLDVRLPGSDGLAAMASFRERLGSAPIIVITAFGDLQTAVRAVEQGAFEYVLKPFDLAEIRAAVQRALQVLPPQPDVAAADLECMLGSSPVMQETFKSIAFAAASDAAVLFYGESGVGKELAARAIHRHSARRDAPFVAVNIAALSATLAEAELFGHVEGAFTGAGQTRKGLLLQANGGTLFLDEVADIPLPLQVKLLRALDQGEVLPVGADVPVKTHFRVVSATHQNLSAKVRAGDFRHDLLFRLCTFEIALSPLRERRDDIADLARHFVRLLGRPETVLALETLAELRRRPWHGNVRELRNAVEHALVLARSGVVLPMHLPPPLAAWRLNGDKVEADRGAELKESLRDLAADLLRNPSLEGGVYDSFLEHIEPPLLSAAMNLSGQQCAAAARALGLHRTTLKRKLDRYRIHDESNGGE